MLATGLATAVVGLPMELGSLIAGLLLAETEFRRQIEVTIDPFKGLLLGVFLISVGMSLDLGHIVADAPRRVPAASSWSWSSSPSSPASARAFGLSWLTGLQAGLLLGPGGEFGFVILGLARAEHLISAGRRALSADPRRRDDGVHSAAVVARQAIVAPRPRRRRSIPRCWPHAEDATPRVIIAGFGRVGETVASLLDATACPMSRSTATPTASRQQRQLRRSVFWGDITQIELLHRLHIDTARALVVTMSDHAASDRLVPRRGRSAPTC